jgi:hypothetical protein
MPDTPMAANVTARAAQLNVAGLFAVQLARADASLTPEAVRAACEGRTAR